ncbi:hypothetical protein KI614_14410 [Dechloromonas denitrificans]|uniref:hypothetical protein n=1 Tax=Dechloromonas denitrificans TaxID=281362 RepID=UPI001CF8458F|nr:hypothetical protein [Dechloromonas denitrificans]UCV11321.1 hypothetical protein KI614_14410 [Dechloromonas denitrificans]
MIQDINSGNRHLDHGIRSRLYDKVSLVLIWVISRKEENHMASDWSFVPSIISAASGLLGVWMGGRLTWKRESLRENERINKESSYLAILVIAHLDRFINGCVQVSFDDGTSEGRPAGSDGIYHTTTVKVPAFSPLELDVDWKVLPADLMYGILNLPYKVEQLANHLSGVSEFDDPPEYTEYFWARQYGFSVLGLEVSELVRRLRQHANLPTEEPLKGDWNRDEILREQGDKIEKARAAYEARMKLP